MKSLPCPNEDKGICTVPDVAVVVSARGVSLMRAELVEDLREALHGEPQLRDFADTSSYDQLVIDAGEALMRGDDERQQRFLAFAEDGKRSVIVNCSCGHTFLMDI